MLHRDYDKNKKIIVPRRNVFIVPVLTTIFQRFWGYIYIRRFMKF